MAPGPDCCSTLPAWSKMATSRPSPPETNQTVTLAAEVVLNCTALRIWSPRLAYSGNGTEAVEKFAAANADLLGDAPEIVSVGCTIGTHIGPGVVAIAYFAKA